MAERDHTGSVGDEILDVHLIRHGHDRGATGVAVFRLELGQVLLDQLEDLAGICQQPLQVGDALADAAVFLLDLVAFQPGELVEAHLQNGVSLLFAEQETGHQAGAGLVAIARLADGTDNFIEVIERDQEPFEDVLARLGLVEFEARAAGDHFEPVVDVTADQLLEIHHLRPVLVDGQHDRAKGHLEMGMLV